MISKKSFLNSLFFLFVLLFIVVIFGAIPFYSIPTLGQVVTASGYAESFVNHGFSIYATNFGGGVDLPKSFGLPGSIIQSLFIKIFNLHSSDAYSFMIIFWLIVALFGTVKFSTFLGSTYRQGLFLSLIYLTLPIVWWHSNYSFLSLGYALLPLYIFSAFTVSYDTSNILKEKIFLFLAFLFISIISIFMDGYTFMMFAVATIVIFFISVIAKNKYNYKNSILNFIIIFISFVIAYYLYTSYLGVNSFKRWPIDYFRGFGIDISMLFRPTEGVMWLWDIIGFSIKRSSQNYFGDASVWITTFSLIFMVIGGISYIITKKNIYKITFLFIALIGLYLSLGPSLKINSTRSISDIKIKNFIPAMKSDEAICSTGNAFLYENIPGFKSTRATYRWIGLFYIGLFGLIILGSLFLIKKNKHNYVYIIIIFIIVTNIPNIFKRINMTHNLRERMYLIDNDLVLPIMKSIEKNSKVAFLPYSNDHIMNYLSAKSNINVYNVGGDKNLEIAKKYWPKSMLTFSQNNIGQCFISNIENLLFSGDAKYVVIPYFDLLWSAYSWPRKQAELNENREKYKKYIDYFIKNKNYKVEIKEFFVFISVKKEANYNLNDNKCIQRINCNSSSCIWQSLDIESNVFHKVGYLNEKGIQTNNKKGLLLYGPYKPIEKGKYNLIFHGNVFKENNGTKIILAYNMGKNKIYKFENIVFSNSENNSIIYKIEDIVINKDIKDIEIKVYVGSESNFLISSYKLSKQKNKTNLIKYQGKK